MMESSNLNLDLHHQEDFHGSSSSLALQGWNQDLILNSAEFPHGALPSSRDFMRTNNGMPMVQELGFQWTPSGHDQGYMMNMNQSSSSSSSSHQPLGFHIPKNNIKEELSIASTINLHDYSLMPFQCGSFSNVFPSENVSGSVLQSFCPNPLGMDLQALDLLASARFGRTMSQPLFDGYGLGQLQEQAQAQVSTSYHKAPHSVSGVTEAKRNNSLDGGTTQPASLTKKPRFESRSSFTPFKVRKEKLGDRIAALQQLVAPFGKTDTASVLMEAIGYIKFLQDQVETLSVPYMRSSNNKKSRTSQGAESSKEKDEAKPDLRSRGLCLVPLSCTSYVTNENGGVWSPPNYQGGT